MMARLTVATLGVSEWCDLAVDAGLPEHPRPRAFRGTMLAWNCRSRDEVDAVLKFAVQCGASLLKAAHETVYGGYSGYFADPGGHPWEAVMAPGIEVSDDGRVHLPDQSVFERSMSSGLTRGWNPVRVKKTRQNKIIEPRF